MLCRKSKRVFTVNDFLEMVNGGKPEKVPFWFMRQAGRYLPEYRDIRSRSSGFLEMVYSPDVACEVTLQPLRRFDMDAAIIFSDILIIAQALGQNLEFVENYGPKLDPLENGKNIASLGFSRFDEMLEPVYEAVSLTQSAIRENFAGDKALIGFCGAPWTLACYMIEGGNSGAGFLRTKAFSYMREKEFAYLIEMLIQACIIHLQKQVRAGAQAVQIFDSWAGIADAHSFVKWVIEPTKKIVKGLRDIYPDIPIIGFPKGVGGGYLRYVKDTGVDVLNIDSSIDTSFAAAKLQPLAVIQGNLDPACLLAGGEALVFAAEKIIDDLKNKAGGFVFNLGHGIHKDTSMENVEMLVKIIREKGRL